MDFAYHRLIPLANNNYELIVYLDFKTEIGKLSVKEIIDHTDQIQKNAAKFIADYFPGVRITSVKVMLGAVIVTSFLTFNPGTANDINTDIPTIAKPPNEQHSTISEGNNSEAVIPPTTKPGEKPPSAEESDPVQPTWLPPPNYGTSLVLVNKHHSLRSDYIPANLVSPQVRFTFAEDLPQRYMQAEAAVALEQLFEEASQQGKILYAVSGYRSYRRQAEIYAYNSANSADANRFSARAGQSEHQTGLAMDITTALLGTLTQEFGSTAEGRWVSANVSRFGFIIRYPNGKETVTGYAYEPWHIRYVGVEAAQAIMKSSLTLEEYLGIKE